MDFCSAVGVEEGFDALEAAAWFPLLGGVLFGAGGEGGLEGPPEDPLEERAPLEAPPEERPADDPPPDDPPDEPPPFTTAAQATS